MQWDSKKKTTHIVEKGIYLLKKKKMNICTGCLEVHKRVQIRNLWYPDTNIPYLINTDNFFTAFTEYKWSGHNISGKQILFFFFSFQVGHALRISLSKGNIFACMLRYSARRVRAGCEALVPHECSRDSSALPCTLHGDMSVWFDSCEHCVACFCVNRRVCRDRHTNGNLSNKYKA